MPSQLPAFRLTVAARMESYLERLAANITRERKRRGESVLDIAVAIGVDKRTVERWEAAEREPQIKKLKALADHWSMDVGDLRPDLKAEERVLRDQLDRIEQKLDALLDALKVGSGGRPAADVIGRAGRAHGADDRAVAQVYALLTEDVQAQRPATQRRRAADVAST